jgi:hypothetical protein
MPSASFSFSIIPPFYETAWFRGLAVLVFGLALLGGHRANLARVRTREANRMRALQEREEELARRVKAALDEIDVLAGLLPICAWCKKVRDDSGYWSQIETYVQAHSRAEFSHGICPECKDREFPYMNSGSGQRSGDD